MSEDRLQIIMAGKGESISVESLVTVLDNMVDILKDVEASLLQSAHSHTDWQVVGATHNSPLNIALAPTEDIEGISRRALDAVVAGMRQIEQGVGKIPAHFTYHTLERAKELVAVLNDGITRLLIVPPAGEALVLTQRTAARVDELLPAPHDEIGSFEGRLETLSIHEKSTFAIWDAISGMRIECHIPEEMLKDALDAFGKRVSVSGRIHYARDARPRSMRVTDLYVFPEQSQLPQFRDLEGMELAMNDI
jgi:hypothetical protein